MSVINTIRERLTYSQDLQPTRDEVDLLFAEIDRLNGTYESAVKGRSDFRKVYREALANHAADVAEMERLRGQVKKLRAVLEAVTKSGYTKKRSMACGCNDRKSHFPACKVGKILAATEDKK